MSRNLNNTKWFVLFLDLSEKKFCFIGQVTGSLRRAIINRQSSLGEWNSANLLQSPLVLQQATRRATCCSFVGRLFLETSINHCHGDEAAVHPSVAGL